jgi:hypothetical protein
MSENLGVVEALSLKIVEHISAIYSIGLEELINQLSEDEIKYLKMSLLNDLGMLYQLTGADKKVAQQTTGKSSVELRALRMEERLRRIHGRLNNWTSFNRILLIVLIVENLWQILLEELSKGNSALVAESLTLLNNSKNRQAVISTLLNNIREKAKAWNANYAKPVSL